MSNLKDMIGALVTEPQTLQQERTGKTFFVDENTAPITNENNLLSLMTRRDFYEDGDGKVPDEIGNLFKNVAQEESRYMMTALAVLADKSEHGRKIQNKFGRDFDAAKSIAKLLKQKADEREFDNTLKPFVDGLATGRSKSRHPQGIIVDNAVVHDAADAATESALGFLGM
jgi:hypothetical protein